VKNSEEKKEDDYRGMSSLVEKGTDLVGAKKAGRSGALTPYRKKVKEKRNQRDEAAHLGQSRAERRETHVLISGSILHDKKGKSQGSWEDIWGQLDLFILEKEYHEEKKEGLE